MALLEVENLQTHFRTPDGVNRAVDGVSFHVEEGETLAVVGESGCGKSVTADSHPAPDPRAAGQDRRLDPLPQAATCCSSPTSEMREIRGNDISMIFQEPMTSLNPVLTIGRQLGETLRLHQGRRAARGRRPRRGDAALVGIPEPSGASSDIPTSSPAACASA